MSASPSATLRDPARLAAIRRAAVLDAPAEEGFDQLTALACRVFGVPVALVSIVDADRQFFKSCVGLPEPWCSKRETPLSYSFCQHVVATGQRLVIEDAREAPLVLDSRAITELGVIAYAGIPLTMDRQTLGTLCIIDHVPRAWSTTELQLLQHLGACVMDRIELGMRVAEQEGMARELSTILDSALDAFIRLDASGAIVGWSAQASAMFGWSANEVVERTLSETVFPARSQGADRRTWKQLGDDDDRPLVGRRFERIAIDRDGREFSAELSVTAVHVGGDRQVSLFVRDISARTEHEAAVRRATERFELVARATSDAVWDWDLRTNALWWNESFYALFGYTPAEIEPGIESWYTRLHAEDEPSVVRGIHAVIDGGGAAWWDEYRFRRADGTYAVILDRGSVIRTAEGEAVRMVGAMTDMTGRKQAEAAQLESEKRYRLLFEHNPEAMWVYDQDTLRVLAVNNAAIRRYGFSRSEFLEMTIAELRPASEVPQLRAILTSLQGGPHMIGGQQHQTKDGALLDAEITSDAIPFAGRDARLVLARDVTAHRALENEFRQAQKMEAVGQLAGGVAHDFNNLLTAITGYSELLRADLSADDPKALDVDEIQHAAQRAAALTQQLLAFSRRQRLDPHVLDLNALVMGTCTLLRRLLGERIVLDTTLDPRQRLATTTLRDRSVRRPSRPSRHGRLQRAGAGLFTGRLAHRVLRAGRLGRGRTALAAIEERAGRSQDR